MKLIDELEITVHDPNICEFQAWLHKISHSQIFESEDAESISP